MHTRMLILDFIKAYFKEHCYAPSHEEIMEAVGLKSKSSVHHHVRRLMEDGDLECDIIDSHYVPRGFRPKGFVCVDTSEFIIVRKEAYGKEANC